ncbi:hypothetical protein [Nonomuraea sp. NPDC050310]|uniref:hypothetical protein n=1 Tax=Nonomuraea sp. NPDC050310 TaxID=3154935 RepID=UPI0033E73C5D
MIEFHARDADTCGDDPYAGVGQHGIEGRGELGVAVADEEPSAGARLVQVHEEVAAELGDPWTGGMGAGAEDADAAGGMLDDGEDVESRPGQGADLEEVTRQECVGLVAQEVGPAGVGALWGGSDTVLFQDPPHSGSGDPDTECG